MKIFRITFEHKLNEVKRRDEENTLAHTPKEAVKFIKEKHADLEELKIVEVHKYKEKIENIYDEVHENDWKGAVPSYIDDELAAEEAEFENEDSIEDIVVTDELINEAETIAEEVETTSDSNEEVNENDYTIDEAEIATNDEAKEEVVEEDNSDAFEAFESKPVVEEVKEEIVEEANDVVVEETTNEEPVVEEAPVAEETVEEVKEEIVEETTNNSNDDEDELSNVTYEELREEVAHDNEEEIIGDDAEVIFEDDEDSTVYANMTNDEIDSLISEKEAQIKQLEDLIRTLKEEIDFIRSHKG